MLHTWSQKAECANGLKGNTTNLHDGAFINRSTLYIRLQEVDRVTRQHPHFHLKQLAHKQRVCRCPRINVFNIHPGRREAGACPSCHWAKGRVRPGQVANWLIGGGMQCIGWMHTHIQASQSSRWQVLSDISETAEQRIQHRGPTGCTTVFRFFVCWVPVFPPRGTRYCVQHPTQPALRSSCLKCGSHDLFFLFNRIGFNSQGCIKKSTITTYSANFSLTNNWASLVDYRNCLIKAIMMITPWIHLVSQQ